MVRIGYDLSEADYIAVNLHVFRRSPATRRSMILAHISKMIVLFCFPCLLAIVWKSWIPIGLGVLWIGIDSALIGRTWRRRLEKHLRKMLSEGGGKGIVCHHELELVGDGFIERTEVNETKTTWEGIEGIESTEEYTFIYTGAMQAYTIPKAGVVEGDYEEFVAELMRRHEAQTWVGA